MRKLLFTVLCAISALTVKADEGMWMICNLSQRTDSILKELGLELSPEEIYSADKPSLNNAIVMFGGFCSGVVVSPEGLVFTNHHCGFGAIQEHSTPKHDYLKDGFVAKKYKDELPNPELFVAFHLKTVDVTDKILSQVSDTMSLRHRSALIDSISGEIAESVNDSANFIYGEVVPYYKGSKYYLSVYQRFNDVRLVFAPPQSLGKFGGDTDNWVWPRETCDFSVFRIYADKNNKPANYSKDNVPYRPIRYANVSLKGYSEGSYCMTLGYPGSTDRYLSSYGIENTMRTVNDVREQVRGVKLGVLKESMNSSDAIRIMYASKYANSSNYWKYSIGMNQALEKLGVINEKKETENQLKEWILKDTVANKSYVHLLDTLEMKYKNAFETNYEMTLLEESFWGGADILSLALKSMVSVVEDGGTDFQKQVEKAYKDIDVETDKKVFIALIKNYAEQVRDTAYLMDFYKTINEKFNGDYAAFADSVYAASIFSRPADLAKVEKTADIYDDPIFDIASEVIAKLYLVASQYDQEIYYCERLLGDAVRKMNSSTEYYADANFTLRLSYGIVEAYSPSESFRYKHYTKLEDIIAKNEKYPDNPDYELLPSVKKWLKSGDFGKYKDKESGEMRLCFLTNNDITGGNSGSGMFDGKGRLIGLAFDGNWEAMSSNVKFDSSLSRCIGVDIRYVLSVIEKYGKAKRLIKELTLEE